MTVLNIFTFCQILNYVVFVLQLSPDWQTDYEVYSWKKLDANKPETKDMVNKYFAWTATDSKGRKFNQGKIFK